MVNKNDILNEYISPYSDDAYHVGLSSSVYDVLTYVYMYLLSCTVVS